MGHDISGIIDADGHIRERDTEIVEFLDEPYRSGPMTLNYPFFPTLDGFQRGALSVRMGKGEPRIDAETWLAFLDEAGIDSTVLYPTAGLGCGLIQDPEWAVAISRGYNNWFSERFHKVSPRLFGVAMLPLQDPNEAVLELRRAVNELGMLGGMIPANSANMGVKKPLGDRSFWPIYEEAERLDCPIAVHGAVSMGLGIEFVEDVGMANRLEHPLAQLIQFTSMMLSGMFDEYPKLKVAYLEADTGWAPYMADRLAGRVKPGMTEPLDVIRSGRIFFSSEGDDPGLPYAIERFGDDALIYASDYPHEPRPRIIEELQEAIERPDVSEESKQKIYWDNPRRLYRWDIANTLPREDASLLTR